MPILRHARIGLEGQMVNVVSRRQVLVGGMAATAGIPVARAQSRAQHSRSRKAASNEVNFISDGLLLSPADYIARLDEIARESGITADEYSRGGTVAGLEARFAQLLAKEAAIFMPTGTLANHLALRAHCARGERVLVQERSHIYNDSGDCVQVLSQLTLVPLGADRAAFSLEDVEREIAAAPARRVANRIGAISIESPVRRRSGEVFPLQEIERIASFARSAGIAMHLDGARLLIASAWSGIAPAEYAKHFDTVYVSLYKGLNAASGAILAGPKRLLEGLHHTRRQFGAGLPAAWPFAAVPLAELDGIQQRLREAAGIAEDFLRHLEGDGTVQIERVPNGTNVFRLVLGSVNPALLVQHLARAGIRARLPQGDPARLTVTVNESWRRRTGADLAQQFLRALRQSGA